MICDDGLCCKFVRFDRQSAQIIDIQTLEKLDGQTDFSLLQPGEILSDGTSLICRLPSGFVPLFPDSDGSVCLTLPDSKPARDVCFQITAKKDAWIIQPGDNTPLYVNGKRIAKGQTIVRGDWIFATGVLFVFYEDMLLLAAKSAAGLEGFQPVLARRKENLVRCGSFFPAILPEPEQIRIEAPVNDESSSVESASSPAGMMLISSLASAISVFLMNPGDLKSVLYSTMGSGLTAIAFVIWYARLGHRQKLKQKEKAQKVLSSYIAYLEQSAKKLDQKRLAQSQTFFDQLSRVESLDEAYRAALPGDGWQMPAGFRFAPTAQIELPQISWQLENERALAALRQLSMMKPEAPDWVLMPEGGVLDVSGWQTENLMDLFSVWVWMVWTERRRFAFVGFEESEVPEHPAVFLDERKLCFARSEAFLSFALLHPQIEWTLLSRQSIPENRLPPGCTFFDASSESNRSLSVYTQSAGHTGGQNDSQSNFRLHLGGEGMIPLCLHLDPKERKKKLRQSCFHTGLARNAAAPVPACLKQGPVRKDRPELVIDLAPGVRWDLIGEGPHALIAGSTGSGKSEGLCGALFQLAWMNSPRQVQFLLIDFKGGAFGAPLMDLAHTAGYLTNLQAGAITRMETALAAELSRRQNLISDWLLTHPGAEPSIEGCPQLGLSHILICVDEFGQLRQRAPEFMKSLQETARIGRSLGIHLILSTQKPAGVVDEQIWANSKSRLCFGVLDPADSREVLGHEEAAKLKAPGEFILQVQPSGEKRGRAYYLKNPADGKSQIEYLDEQAGWTVVERPSLQDELRRKILDLHEERRWILLPDPVLDAANSSQILIDCIDHTEVFSWRCSSMVLVGSEAALVQALTALLQDCPLPVSSTLDLPCADQIIDPAALWYLDEHPTRRVVILHHTEKADPVLLEKMMSSSQIHLILALGRIPFSLEGLVSRFEARIFLDLDSREQRSALFSGKTLSEQSYPACTAWIDRKEERLIIGQNTPALRQPVRTDRLPECRIELSSQEIEPAETALFLGQLASSGRPCFWKGQPLTLLFSTPSGRQAAETLLERLQLQDELFFSEKPQPQMICVYDLVLSGAEQLPVLALDAGKAGIWIFFGKGFEQAACLAGFQMPYERSGNALFFDGETLHDFISARVLET